MCGMIGVNTVIAYNSREIPVFEKQRIPYILKIEFSNSDIGININNLDTILEGNTLAHICGVCITVSKKWFMNRIRETTGAVITPTDNRLYREIYNNKGF
jgi:hypothetical protein